MKLRNKGLNYLQLALLNRGSYTNTDLAKIYQTGARVVQTEDGPMVVNRRLRRSMSKRRAKIIRAYLRHENAARVKEPYTPAFPPFAGVEPQ